MLDPNKLTEIYKNTCTIFMQQMIIKWLQHEIQIWKFQLEDSDVTFVCVPRKNKVW